MKKSILQLAMVLMCVIACAQNATYNVIIFSEDGEPFFVYANGIRQNDKPETNVKITGLTSEALSMRVQFENKALPVLKQNFMPEFGYEHTVNIKKNLKKSMKLAYFGRVPLAEAPRTTAATVQYHTAENPVIQNNSAQNQNSPVVQESSTPAINTNNESYSQNVTTTLTSPNVNINFNGSGVNMNISDNGTSVTTTSTTVITTGASGSSTMSTVSATAVPRHKPTTTGTATNVATTSSVIPRPMNPNATSTTATSTVASNAGCSTPMNDEEYEKLKTTIDDTPFADNKIAMAKAATKNNCLSIAQIKGICELMPMDDHKLTYAKYAYDYCTEKKNYYQVGESFSFPNTTQKLNKFLQTK